MRSGNNLQILKAVLEAFKLVVAKWSPLEVLLLVAILTLGTVALAAVTHIPPSPRVAATWQTK